LPLSLVDNYRCKPNEWACTKTGTCISVLQVCNQEKQCIFGEDEEKTCSKFIFTSKRGHENIQWWSEINFTNINKTNNHLTSWLNSLNTKRLCHVTLEIQVLAWDRHKNVVGLNLLTLPSRCVVLSVTLESKGYQVTCHKGNKSCKINAWKCLISELSPKCANGLIFLYLQLITCLFHL
jgi:hypothetical protein